MFYFLKCHSNVRDKWVPVNTADGGTASNMEGKR